MDKDKGLKFNQGKTKHDLVPAFAQEQYAKVLTFGAGKYSPHNWEKGIVWSDVIAAIKRHTLAIERCEDFDPETGLLHSAHLMCEAGFLTEFYKIFPQGDDRIDWYSKGFKVGLDIDDVLADFVPTFCKEFNIPIPKFWNFEPTILDMLKSLSKDFWLNLPLRTNPDDIPFEPHCYITSRIIPIDWTNEWLYNNGFAQVPVYQIDANCSKVEAAKKSGIDIFVDDKFSNYQELNNAGIMTYLMTAPYNKRYRIGHKRINEVSDIVNRF